MGNDKSHINSTVIVLGITDNWIFAAATVLLGVKKYTTKKNFDVIIFHQNLNSRNKKSLNKIFKCQFIQFDESKINSKRFKKITKMAFSVYECLTLLPKYKRVIWLDADLVIKGNIDELTKTNFSQDIAMYNRGIPLEKDFERSSLDKKYNMKTGCFNSGVIVFTNIIKNPLQIKNWCYSITNNFSRYIHGDQSVINIALQEFNIKTYQLNEKYNCLPEKSYSRKILDVRIIHPRGEKCFWKNLIDLQWDKYYYEWKKIGGEGPKLPFPIKRKIRHLLNWISPNLEYYIRTIWKKLNQK